MCPEVWLGSGLWGNKFEAYHSPAFPTSVVCACTYVVTGFGKRAVQVCGLQDLEGQSQIMVALGTQPAGRYLTCLQADGDCIREVDFHQIDYTNFLTKTLFERSRPL